MRLCVVVVVKKAYYRLSLQIHPDRVAESEKEEATEKFKVLTKINAVLTDSDKKALYDQQGIIDDDGEAECNWLKMWREFFKPITTTDIENFHQSYIGMLLDRARQLISEIVCKNGQLHATVNLFFSLFWYV